MLHLSQCTQSFFLLAHFSPRAILSSHRARGLLNSTGLEIDFDLWENSQHGKVEDV
jgi:hypothetical protein